MRSDTVMNAGIIGNKTSEPLSLGNKVPSWYELELISVLFLKSDMVPCSVGARFGFPVVKGNVGLEIWIDIMVVIIKQ